MLFVLVVFAAGTVAVHWPQNHNAKPAPAHWQQVFSDSFDTPLDLGHWTLYTGAAPNSNPATGWWSADHVTVGDGQLRIGGYPDTTPNGERRIVTGGAGLYEHAQVYGKWLARVRFDACDQVKYAVLLWPVSGDWPNAGEIDFAEDEGGSRTNTTASVVYASPNTPRKFAARSQTIVPEKRMSQWHTVGVEWTPDAIRFTLDGRYWGEPVTSHIPKSPMAFVVQTEAVAPAASGPNLRCDAYVDWVRQYRLGA